MTIGSSESGSSSKDCFIIYLTSYFIEIYIKITDFANIKLHFIRKLLFLIVMSKLDMY